MKLIMPFILSALFTLVSDIAHGQLDPGRVSHFDELRGTTIYDIETDRMGNLWIGTQSGLVKFDGYEYTRYPPDLNDTTTMGELLIYQITEDKNGDLWIGAQGAIYRYDPRYESFTRIRFDALIDNFAQAFTATITPDNRGRVYFGIASGWGIDGSKALVYHDENSDSLKSFHYPDTMNLAGVYRSAMDPDGNIWLLDNTGIYKIDTLYRITRILLPDGIAADQQAHLNGFCVDSSGKIWLTTNLGALIEYNPETKTGSTYKLPAEFNQAFANIYILEMEANHNRDILISSNLGLLGFNKSSKTFYAFEKNPQNRVLNSRATALHSDNFGNLWIGTESDGLLNYSYSTRLSSHKWNENDQASITSGWVEKIFETEEGFVWIVTGSSAAGSGLTKMNPETAEIKPYLFSSLTPGLNWLEIIDYLGSGKLLIESDSGFKIFNTNTFQLRDTVLDFLSDAAPVIDALTDKHSINWYCTYDGLYKHDPLKPETEYFDFEEFQNTSPASNIVSRVIESETHGLWILTDHGLFSYDYEKEQISRHAADNASGDVFSSQDINAFYEGSNGIAWVGTWQGGLNRYDLRTGNIKVYTIDDGLPSMSIQGILHDEKNNDLWLSTFQGISRFNIETEEFTNYLLADGIHGLLFADGQHLKTSNNTFIFGGNNGITYFNPDKIRQNTIPPKVYIEDFKIEDESMTILPYIVAGSNENDQFTYSYDQNNISIDYTGIQYDNPQKNRFAYKLENYDPDWRNVGNIRSAVYYNLPPGGYTFRVKAANSNGVWSEPVSLSFRISPPWWRTVWAYIFYGLVLIAGIIAIDRFQRRRLLEKERQKAREKELAHAREIEKAYEELKATQNQLIQSEKMASLGELTAGIAHEIQNPLNFVNNFSEINNELLDELKEAIAKNDQEEIEAIFKDLKENENKVSNHGKRAESIVKGMLLHSRGSSGQKEPTDINALCDEYLRLAYHGFRAKDKSFNANYQLQPDESLPKMNVVPQDIGRVLLNLINNAFFAVSEKAKKHPGKYKPEVFVKTEQLPLEGGQNGIFIYIRDNGPGIPEKIRDKIFQPFFTTKSTGEGTGLGLSMSYEIITKGHDGEIKVESKEGEGSEFIIQIPIETK